MITTQKVRIEKMEDYDKLYEIIPASHIDSTVVEEIKRVVGLVCKAIIVEYPYYESDYLSNYYIFYSKKLKVFPKYSYRLLLFYDNELTELIGYISLRPTYEGTRIGRSYIEPQYIISCPSSLILSDNKVHFQAGETILKAFPHMKQEGDVAVCAHVALWSVIRSFTNRFHRYPEIKLGELVEMIQPLSQRHIPSHGLTPAQISDVFLQLGLSPVIRSNSVSTPYGITDEVLSYIESGIPIIGLIAEREHAVAIIGCSSPNLTNIDFERLPPNKFEEFADEDGKPLRTNVILATRFISHMVVNDDNYFPYRILGRLPPKIDDLPQEGERLLQKRDTLSYTMRAINHAVIPLYPRIQLVYNDVRISFLALWKTGIYNWSEKIVARIFLTSANTYREYVNQNSSAFSQDLKNIIVHLEMPKFIWVVEVSSPEASKANLVNAIVLVDSTSATINKNPFLLITEKNQIRYVDAEKSVAYSCSSDLLSIPKFNNNLQEVTPYG